MLAKALADIQIGMNRGLYTAASGMWSGQMWLDTVAHNLANASTTGYKRDEIAFEEGLMREIAANGGRGRVLGDIQSGPRVAMKTTAFERGAYQATGNGLDVAIGDHQGMFAVQTPSGTMFARAGAFTLNDSREITDQAGNPVLDENLQPIRVASNGPIKINADGEVLIGDATFGRIAIWRGDFEKVGSNLFRARAEAQVAYDIKLVPESLESSNVNVMATMIEMVQVQRLFEMAQRSVQTHDEITGQLVRSASQ